MTTASPSADQSIRITLAYMLRLYPTANKASVLPLYASLFVTEATIRRRLG
jgi:hypothetical protein